jgi:hypothetical protein
MYIDQLSNGGQNLMNNDYNMNNRSNSMISHLPQSFNNQFMNNTIPNPNINQEMDYLVRNNLKSRGVNMHDFNNRDNLDGDRKRMFLNNIQNQILLTKNTKTMELDRKKKEDEKFLNDMQNNYPFGR